jgi:hypothetical protein
LTDKNFFNKFTRWRCYKTFFLFDGVEYSHASREFVNGRLAGAKLYNYLASLAVTEKKFYKTGSMFIQLGVGK